MAASSVANPDLASDLGGSCASVANQRDAESGALPCDPGLRRIRDAWPTLPPSFRDAIISLVETHYLRLSETR